MISGPGERAQALVVGASSAIGTAVAGEMAELGYRMTLWGRDRDRLEAAASCCARSGSDVTTLALDVTDRSALTAAAAAVQARGRLSLLVWAAGQFDWASAETADPAKWDELIDVNLTSAAHITRLLLPALIAAAPSALIYLGSGSARQVFGHNAAYVASKHGLAGLAGSVFLDVRDRDVKVSLISPGLVAAGAGLASPAAENPRLLLQPREVAMAVRFVVTFPTNGCPTEIVLQPQRTPRDLP